jgi:type IV pilus assembly protein PilC
MPRLMYVARDKGGKRITGTQDASSEEELITRLHAMELTVVNVMPATKEGMDQMLAVGAIGKRAGGHHHQGITSADLVLFCRQLTTLLSAGVTILKSMDTILKQVSSQKLYSVIEQLRKDMEQGLSFHEALARHPKIFSDLWVNLVESGEASGNLAIVLDRLALYLERNAEFNRKLISALIYPLILLFASIVALLFLAIKIVPTFAEVFQGFNMKLPMATMILINISNFIRHYMLLIVIGAVVGFMLFKNYIATKEGRRNWEKFLYGLPLFGEFFRAMYVERFASEMSTLVESGVPILYSLEIAEQSVGSVILAEIIRTVKDDVRSGKPLSHPLDESGFFEPMVIQMISIGEEIGELSQMFKKIDTFYQTYVETFLARILALFEPLILIFMGLVIGLMVIGMFLPIFEMSKVGTTGG